MQRFKENLKSKSDEVVKEDRSEQGSDEDVDEGVVLAHFCPIQSQ